MLLLTFSLKKLVSSFNFNRLGRHTFFQLTSLLHCTCVLSPTAAYNTKHLCLEQNIAYTFPRLWAISSVQILVSQDPSVISRSLNPAPKSFLRYFIYSVRQKKKPFQLKWATLRPKTNRHYYLYEVLHCNLKFVRIFKKGSYGSNSTTLVFQECFLRNWDTI